MKLRLASLLILALALASCRTSRMSATVGGDASASIGSYCYNGVLRAEARGDLNSAYDLLTFIVESDSTFAPAYDKLFAYELGFRKDSLAVALLRKAVEADPSNFWYGFKLANYYASQDSIALAASIYEDLSDAHPDHKELLYPLVSWYMKIKEYPRALAVLDRIEKSEGETANSVGTRMMIYSQTGKIELAKKEMLEKIAQSPDDDVYLNILAQLYVTDRQYADAIDVYEKLLAASPYDGSVTYDWLAAIKISDSAHFEDKARMVLSDPGYQPDLKFEVLLNLIVRDKMLYDNPALVNSMFDIAGKNTPAADVNIPMLHATYCEAVKDTTGAIAAYREVIGRDPANEAANQSLLNLVINRGNIDDLYSVCKNASKQFPDKEIYSYFYALSCLFKGLDDEAEAACQEAIKHIGSDSHAPFVSQIYSILGDSYHEDGDDGAAFDAYEQALKYDPDNTAVLNNYAYFLAISGGDLDKAEGMIDHAIELDPDDPTMLDTYAWILFLQKDYALAKMYMDKTLSLDEAPTAEILEHAGDIYMMCGEADKALDYWKQALQKDESSETLKAKIKQRKYIAPQ